MTESPAIELHLITGTVWLTQQELAELFSNFQANISKHIKAIFDDGEFMRGATVNYKLAVQKRAAEKYSSEMLPIKLI